MAELDAIINLRLSGSFLTRLKAAINYKKGQRSKAIRIALEAGIEAQNLEALKKRIQIYEDLTDELRANRANLSRVGGNLNQLSRLFNLDEFGKSQHKDLGKTHEELRSQFEIVIKTITEAQDEIGRI